MAQPTLQVSVAERNLQVSQTSDGRPKLGVRTGTGRWVQVTGAGVENIKVGQDLVIDEPTQVGKQFFASLREIKSVQSSSPSANGNGAKGGAGPRFEAKPEKITWDEFERTMRAAHALIIECEPDGYGPIVGETETKEGEPHTVAAITIDRSQARAAMFNTIVIALTKDGGRVTPAPELPF